MKNIFKRGPEPPNPEDRVLYCPEVDLTFGEVWASIREGKHSPEITEKDFSPVILSNEDMQTLGSGALSLSGCEPFCCTDLH